MPQRGKLVLRLKMSIRSGKHCVFNLNVHLVFVTKYRRKIFTSQMLNFLKSSFEITCLKFDAELKEFNGEKDHVHLLVNYPSKISVSKLVNALKGTSSRKLRIYFKSANKHYLKNHFWSPSYFAASCGGAPLDILKEYIQNQNHPNSDSSPP